MAWRWIFHEAHVSDSGHIVVARNHRHVDKAPRQIHLARPYGHPLAQFPPCNVCAVVRFIRKDSLSGCCKALWNGYRATKG